MDTAEKTLLIIGVIGACLLILLLGWANIEAKKQDKVNFLECNSKAQDLEWCYKNFFR